MLNAKVMGSATSTVKHPSLEGVRLLVVQPYGPGGTTPDGHPLLAVDGGFGSSAGDQVLLTSDGRHTRQFLKDDNTPVRWTVIGLRDQ